MSNIEFISLPQSVAVLVTSAYSGLSARIKRSENAEKLAATAITYLTWAKATCLSVLLIDREYLAEIRWESSKKHQHKIFKCLEH